MAQHPPSGPSNVASCSVRILQTDAARASTLNPALPAPADGWEPVTLPDLWTSRWPTHDGAVWYRIAWERACDGPPQVLDAESAVAPTAVALGIDGISVAGLCEP